MGRCLVVGILTIFVTFRYSVIAKPSLQIVNGTTADEGEFPYLVQLYSRRTNLLQCGGSILGPEWILTAAQCIDDDEVGFIIYGTNMLYNSSNTIEVKKSIQHPKFQPSGNVPIYDVGIIQLAKPIVFNELAQPIPLAEVDDIPFHVQGVLAGWGGHNTSGDPMEYLQKIYLELLTDEECEEEITDIDGPAVFNSTYNLCSNNFWNGQCRGDGGSPFVINGTQYGIVSWMYKPCGSAPGAYSRITNPEYLEWIKNVTDT